MANTISGMTFENVARMGLSAFVDALIPLRAFTLDLSADAAEQGTVVKTRIVPVAGTVGDLTDTHTGSYTDAINDLTFSEVKVTMGSEPVIAFAFTDREMNEINSGVFTDTVQRSIRQHAYAIANNVLDGVFATIDTTFSTAKTAASSAFDVDDVMDIREYAVATGAWRMTGDESLVLGPAYYTALLKDNAIQDKSASGLNATIDAAIPKVGSFKVIEAPSLPGAAVNNTVGFAAKPEGIAIAMRGVGTQAENDFLGYEVMQDDETGVVLTVKSWFDRTYHRVVWSFETLWGVADGNTSALLRVTSA